MLLADVSSLCFLFFFFFFFFFFVFFCFVGMLTLWSSSSIAVQFAVYFLSVCIVLMFVVASGG